MIIVHIGKSMVIFFDKIDVVVTDHRELAII